MTHDADIDADCSFADGDSDLHGFDGLHDANDVDDDDGTHDHVSSPNPPCCHLPSVDVNFAHDADFDIGTRRIEGENDDSGMGNGNLNGLHHACGDGENPVIASTDPSSPRHDAHGVFVGRTDINGKDDVDNNLNHPFDDGPNDGVDVDANEALISFTKLNSTRHCFHFFESESTQDACVDVSSNNYNQQHHDLHGPEGLHAEDAADGKNPPIMASTKFNVPPHRLTLLEAECSHVSSMLPHGKKVLSASCILQLAYQSIGVVYGDVGTSPLYVFTSTFPDGLHPVRYTKDILGSLSLIIYTLTLIPLIKYVCIVLWANDNGDGGTFALYSLICRGANVSLLPNQQVEDRELSFYKLQMPSRQLDRALKLKRALEKSLCAKTSLLFMALLGTCMVIGDGVLTPAISVLSAVSGIQAATSTLHQNAVVIMSVLVLIALFSVQRFGTSKVGFVFAPVLLIWFVCIGCIGLYNIFKYDPSIFRAFNPKCIIDYFHGNLMQAWISLGGIVLCITGAEAMFADLGHFSVPSIQIAFGFVVYPCCLLAYLGQAAYLMKNPKDVANTFYKSIPEPVYWPMFTIAVAAAIIASQAMVSATFSIVKQSMALCCFPIVKVVHTSSTVAGQVYVPEVNWVLMLAAIIVTAAFRSTDKLGNAYGIAVVGVMVVTTFFLTLIMILIWQIPLWMILAFLTVFGLIDLLYFSSVLFKFDQGGYLPLAFAVGLLFIMYVWHYGADCKHNFELRRQMSESAVQDLVGSATRIPGIAFVYTELANGIPCIFSHTVKNLPALHAVVVFVCVKFLPVTRVMDDERFLIRRVGKREIHMFRCVARYGYKDVQQDNDCFEQQLLQNLEDFITQEAHGCSKKLGWELEGGLNTVTKYECEPSKKTSQSTGVLSASKRGLKRDDQEIERAAFEKPIGMDKKRIAHSCDMNGSVLAAAEELHFMKKCKDAGVVYLIGNSEVRASKSSSALKKLLVDHVYNMLRRNCRKTSVALVIPQERLLEVGMVYEV